MKLATQRKRREVAQRVPAEASKKQHRVGTLSLRAFGDHQIGTLQSPSIIGFQSKEANKLLNSTVIHLQAIRQFSSASSSFQCPSLTLEFTVRMIG